MSKVFEKWKFLSLFLVLFMVLGICTSVKANEFARIVDESSIVLLDAEGNEITTDTKLKYGDIVTIVVDGLKPNTDYSVQIGWTETSTGTNLSIDTDGDGIFDPGELSNPSLNAAAGYDVRTDANGHFTIQYMVGDIACDSEDANRTITIHEGTGTSPGSPVLTANAFGIQPVIELTLDNEAAYGNPAGVTWEQLGFTTTEGKVNDTAGSPIVAAADCPYKIAVHGFAGKAGYRTISFTMGGTDVPLWDPGAGARVTSTTLTANGTLAVANMELAIPEIPAGTYPIIGVDAKGNTATYDFTVKPALLYNAGAGTDDPANDIEIRAQTNGSEVLADQGGNINAFSGIGFPAGTIAANSIIIGGKATTHTAINVGNNGAFANETITLASDAQVGISDVVIGDYTFSSVMTIGDDAAAAALTTVSSDSVNVGDTIMVGISNIDDDDGNADAESVYYEILDNTGTTILSGPTDSGKDLGVADGADQEQIFALTIPDLPNTYDASGNIQQLILRVWEDEDGTGTYTGGDDSDDINITVNPKVVTGAADINNNGNLDANEISTEFSNGNIIAIDISGFVNGDTVQVSVDGVPHSVLNAGVGILIYGDLDPAGAGFTIQANGTTQSGGVNELMVIMLGDTDGDGVVDNPFASGEHTITVTGSTYGSTATTTITVVTPVAAIARADSNVYTYAPTNNPYNGVSPTLQQHPLAPFNVIPGATVYLSVNNPTGNDFKANTNYLILFDNSQDTLNLIKVGSFTSTTDGQVPIGTSFIVPETALPGTHNVLIAEDVNGNGEYDADTDSIVVGPNAMTLVVYANVVVDHYIRHIGDTVTVTVTGFNPENETDPEQATVYQILLDQNNNGPDIYDPVFPEEGFTPDKDGHATVSFSVPEMPGGVINMYVVEKDTLVRNEPQTLINVDNIDPGTDITDLVGVDEDAEIFITPNITLDHYTGNPGDTITISGKGFQPGVAYVVTFGYINDAAINQRGQVVTNFIADENGLIPEGTSFTVPTANNSAYGVVVDPTPASNYVDVARDTGTGLMSVLMAGDQPIFTVGGVATTLISAAATDSTHVDIAFSGALQSATANNAANYTLAEKDTGTPVPVTSALYDAATYTVTLTLGASLEVGKAYELTVSNLRDSYNNPVSGTVEFTYRICPTINAMTLDMGSILSGGTGIVDHYDFGEFGTTGTMPYIYVQTATASDFPVDVYVKVTYPDDRSAWLYEEAGAMIYHDPTVTPNPEYSSQVFSEGTVLPILTWWFNPDYKDLTNAETGGYELPDGTYTWTIYLVPAGTSISSPDDVETNACASATASVTLTTDRP